MIRKAVGAIVSFQDKYLLVHKININTPVGNKRIQGEWDFIKGGVNKSDSSLKHFIVRELHEETGSTNYRMIEMYEDKLCFEFPPELQIKMATKAGTFKRNLHIMSLSKRRNLILSFSFFICKNPFLLGVNFTK